MTVSQRASEIYKTNPRITRWVVRNGHNVQLVGRQAAMSQAYDEIARQAAEQEERESREEIEDKSTEYEEAYDGKADLLYDMNQLIAEIIIEAIDKREEKGVIYPAASILNQIENKISGEVINDSGIKNNFIGWNYIDELVFWGSGDRNFDMKWRGSDGKINSEWRMAVINLMDALGVEKGDLDNYAIVMTQFR